MLWYSDKFCLKSLLSFLGVILCCEVKKSKKREHEPNQPREHTNWCFFVFIQVFFYHRKFHSIPQNKIYIAVYLYFCRRASKTFENFSARDIFLLCFNKKKKSVFHSLSINTIKTRKNTYFMKIVWKIKQERKVVNSCCRFFFVFC